MSFDPRTTERDMQEVLRILQDAELKFAQRQLTNMSAATLASQYNWRLSRLNAALHGLRVQGKAGVASKDGSWFRTG